VQKISLQRKQQKNENYRVDMEKKRSAAVHARLESKKTEDELVIKQQLAFEQMQQIKAQSKAETQRTYEEIDAHKAGELLRIQEDAKKQKENIKTVRQAAFAKKRRETQSMRSQALNKKLEREQKLKDKQESIKKEQQQVQKPNPILLTSLLTASSTSSLGPTQTQTWASPGPSSRLKQKEERFSSPLNNVQTNGREDNKWATKK